MPITMIAVQISLLGQRQIAFVGVVAEMMI
jgi:hypothetical protein